MSITTNQTPSTFTPGYNPQFFEATSTMFASTGFKFNVICTDVATGGTITYAVKKAISTNELKFDARIFANKYLQHYVPNNVYGWQTCTDAIRKITVELREYYGSTEYPGSPPYTTTYYAWNGALRLLDFIGYNYTDYVYNSATANYKAITSWNYPNSSIWLMGQDNKVYTDKSRFLYILSDFNQQAPEFIRINTYDSNDTLLGTSDIYNPSYGAETYANCYQAIDIGMKGLENISSGLVTGTYPIITSSVAYYNVLVGYNMPPATATINVGTFTVSCEPTYDIYPVHYLAKGGNFETIYFTKASILSETVEKKYYRQNPYELVSNNWVTYKSTPHERVLSSAGQERLILNSDWLSEYEIGIHRELYTSPLVYIDFGSTTGLIPYKVIDTEYQVLKNFNQKSKGLTVTLEPTYKNLYQNG